MGDGWNRGSFALPSEVFIPGLFSDTFLLLGSRGPHPLFYGSNHHTHERRNQSDFTGPRSLRGTLTLLLFPDPTPGTGP